MEGTGKLGAYVAALGGLAATSYLVPNPAGGFVRLAVQAAALGTLIAAILVRRPTRRAGWWLVALSGLVTYGQVVLVLTTSRLGSEPLIPTVPQLVMAIAALLTLGVGLAVLGRRSSRGVLGDALDTTITAAAAFLLAWVFYIDPRLARSASDFATIAAITIPAAALVTFAIGVKIAFGGAMSTWSGRALLLANAAVLCSAGMLIAPIGANTVSIDRTMAVSLSLAHLILLGAAGVAPGFVNVTGDRALTTPDLTVWRTVLFVLLAIIAPLNVAIGFARAQTSGRGFAAIAIPPICGTLILLILVVRLALLARVARRRADDLAQALAKQEELQRQLAYRAHHDSLTGLANRDVLTDRMDTLRDNPSQHPSRGQALVMLDLDGFKEVNDTLGHAAGDEVLVDAAHRLVGAAPDRSVVARLGGDEFAVLMENTAADTARTTAETIRVALRSPYIVAGQQLSLSASIGLLITEPNKQPPTSADGLRDADVALYDAKAAGRDRVAEFTRRYRATGAVPKNGARRSAA